MLALNAITKRFGGLQVLQDFSMTVPDRGIYGLIGPNGAGKTTVFNLITGVLAPDDGTINFHGSSLNRQPPYQIVRRGVARTFQNIRLFKEMTVLENVLVPMGWQQCYGMASLFFMTGRFRRAQGEEQARAMALLAKVGLVEKAGFPAATLSYGEQRRLEIARALASGPRILLLDEPAAGMNSAEKQQLMEEIVKLEAEGLSLLVIEHDMRFIMSLCRRITVLNFGRVIAEGPPEAVRANPQVIEAYLGQSGETGAGR